MQLKELSLNSPKISPEEILQALEAAIPSQKIEAAIERTQSQHQRNRALPTHLVVALIIAMSRWSQDSIEDVLKNLVHGLSSQWVRLSQRWKNPSKSSISEARGSGGTSSNESAISFSGSTIRQRADSWSISQRVTDDGSGWKHP